MLYLSNRCPIMAIGMQHGLRLICACNAVVINYMSDMENVGKSTEQQQPRQRRHKSSVTTGRRLFAPETTDGRFHAAIRYRDILEQIQEDLGGVDMLSEARRQLCRRAATMCAQAEIMEAQAVSGQGFDIHCFATTVNCLRRLFETVGLQRVSRDITPTLQNYLQAKVTPP
jgi:hypothetical protein